MTGAAKKLLLAWCISSLAACAAIATQPQHEEEEEVVELELEGVVVEAEADFRDLQLHETKPFAEFIEKLQVREQRAAALQKTHQSSVTTVLDLTRYSPIPLGGSDPRTDTFFLQNYMRRDLNPPDADPLLLRR
jgi:hypothetical protein